MENSSLESRAEQVIIVESNVSTVCCRGTGNALGHPAVYLTFSDQDSVRCYYCGCEYRRAASSVKGPKDT